MASDTTMGSEQKKGHLRVTLDVEINEGLMEAAKDSMSTISQHLPDMMKRGGTEKEKESR